MAHCLNPLLLSPAPNAGLFLPPLPFRVPAVEFHCGLRPQLCFPHLELSPAPAGLFFAPTVEPFPALRICPAAETPPQTYPCFGPAPVHLCGAFSLRRRQHSHGPVDAQVFPPCKVPVIRQVMFQVVV
jgi:hypothetical protein